VPTQGGVKRGLLWEWSILLWGRCPTYLVSYNKLKYCKFERRFTLCVKLLILSNLTPKMPSSLEEGFFYPRVSHPPCTQVEKPYFVLLHIQHHTHESRDLGKVQCLWYGEDGCWAIIPSNLSIVSKNSMLGIYNASGKHKYIWSFLANHFTSLGASPTLTLALPFMFKSMLRQKKNYGNSNKFHHAKI
jgi:hypothetical protein